ncbi:MAG: CDP-glycerol glycerophosphotransferase family protein, partial [Lachnospiraceae bacterium]|nr:CDP-glycerol glycerophosphotransferase family protein [Lachnospiraceae bacterium]
KSLQGKKGKTIIFLINFPESWNSVKSVYEAAIKDGKYNVYIIAAPQLSSDIATKTGAMGIKNDAYEFFVKNNIDVINASKENGDWIDLRDYNPDYVIYTRPYNDAYPEPFRPVNVCKYAKLYYIPYAYSMLSDSMLLSVLPENFIFCMRKVYLANKSRKIECEKVHPRYGKYAADRFEYLGFPRFDLYEFDETTEKDNKRYTIAWMPRWTAGSAADKHKGSHFLLYYKQVIQFAKDNPNVEVIIRPHPKMFGHFVATGIMSQEEVDDFMNTCESMDNLSLDKNKDYINTIKNSDLLLADYTSLIAEFFMTGKPVVFCDTVEGLNLEGQKICGSLYYAENFDQIKERIFRIIGGNDEEYGNRQKIIHELLPSQSGGIGKSILESIINS